jgi:hypothetical protein
MEHLILVQVPEVSDKFPVLGTEVVTLFTVLLAFTAIQLVVIEEGE